MCDQRAWSGGRSLARVCTRDRPWRVGCGRRLDLGLGIGLGLGRRDSARDPRPRSCARVPEPALLARDARESGVQHSDRILRLLLGLPSALYPHSPGRPRPLCPRRVHQRPCHRCLRRHPYRLSPPCGPPCHRPSLSPSPRHLCRLVHHRPHLLGHRVFPCTGMKASHQRSRFIASPCGCHKYSRCLAWSVGERRRMETTSCFTTEPTSPPTNERTG